MNNLTLLKWKDKDGRPQTLGLIDAISFRWHKVGDLLKLNSSCIAAIASNHPGDVILCCREVLREWLNDGSQSYPATWEGMLNLLEDIKLASISLKLRSALNLL